MIKWEYRTIRVDYDKNHKNWVVEYADRPPLIGLQAVLEAHGSHDWELVSLEAEHFQIFAGFGKWYMEPTAYRATFKRSVED